MKMNLNLLISALVVLLLSSCGGSKKDNSGKFVQNNPPQQANSAQTVANGQTSTTVPSTTTVPPVSEQEDVKKLNALQKSVDELKQQETTLSEQHNISFICKTSNNETNGTERQIKRCTIRFTGANASDLVSAQMPLENLLASMKNLLQQHTQLVNYITGAKKDESKDGLQAARDAREVISPFVSKEQLEKILNQKDLIVKISLAKKMLKIFAEYLDDLDRRTSDDNADSIEIDRSLNIEYTISRAI